MEDTGDVVEDAGDSMEETTDEMVDEDAEEKGIIEKIGDAIGLGDDDEAAE